MEILSQTVKLHIDPETGYISLYRSSDSSVLLQNANFRFTFQTSKGIEISFRPNENNSRYKTKEGADKFLISYFPNEKSIPEFSVQAGLSLDKRAVEIRAEIKNTLKTSIGISNFVLLEADCLKEADLFPEKSPGNFIFFGYKSIPYDLYPNWILPEFSQLGKYTFFGDSISALANAQSKEALIFGFTDSKRYWNKTSLRISQKGFMFHRLRSVCCCDGITLVPGKTIDSETLSLEFSNDIKEGLENWASRSAKAMKCPKTFELPTGWSTWDYYHTDINEENILQNVKFLSERKERFPVDYIQIDAGYSLYGDWLEWNKDKFPHGPEWLVKQIKKHGFKAGIWFMPTVVSTESKLFKEHQDWLLRKKDGNIVFENRSGWEAKGTYAYLDIGLPEVIKWAEDTARSLVEKFGFEYIKTDGGTNRVFAKGATLSTSETQSASFRTMMKAIRKGAGDKVFFLHGAYIPSTVGVVDGNRTGYDIAPRWNSAPEQYEEKLEVSRPFMLRILGNIFNLWFINNKLWRNDPDYLVVREKGGSARNFTEDEAKLWATAVALCSGPIMLSDNMIELPEKRLKILDKVLPAFECRMRPIDFCMDKIPSIISAYFPGENCKHKLVAFFNYTEKTKSFSCDLKELGFDSPVHAFEFWENAYFLHEKGILKSGKIRPHSVKIFILTEKKDHPQIIGTDMHILQLAPELISEKWIPESKILDLTMSPKYKKCGKLFLWLPKGYKTKARKATIKNGSLAEITFTPYNSKEIKINFDE